MKKLKDFILKKRVWVIAAAFIFVIPSSVYAINKGYSHFQVKQIVDQAKILSVAGKHEEAIAVLLLSENKWATKSLKGEVVSELEKNRDLEEQIPEATESGVVIESPIPSPTPKIVKTESKQIPPPISSPSLTITTYSPSPTVGYSPSPNIQYPSFYYNPTPIEDTGSIERERAYLELELNRLTSLYEETKLRYEQSLEDITKPIIDAITAEFTRRGIPLSSDVYSQAVTQAIEPYVNRNKLDKEPALRTIQYQIDLIHISLGY